jgi:hypothetical protein
MMFEEVMKNSVSHFKHANSHTRNIQKWFSNKGSEMECFVCRFVQIQYIQIRPTSFHL